MSDSREELVKTKSARAGIIEQRGVPARSKKAMPIVLESRTLKKAMARPRWNSEWRKWASYRSVREAEQARDNLNRKHAGLWEFRIKPDEPAEKEVLPE